MSIGTVMRIDGNSSVRSGRFGCRMSRRWAVHVNRNDSTEAGMREERDEVFGLLLAGYASQVVRTLAGLSVAEHLDDGELTAQQIAAHASSDPDMTYRVLRAGVALGLLKYD